MKNNNFTFGERVGAAGTHEATHAADRAANKIHLDKYFNRRFISSDALETTPDMKTFEYINEVIDQKKKSN